MVHPQRHSLITHHACMEGAPGWGAGGISRLRGSLVLFDFDGNIFAEPFL